MKFSKIYHEANENIELALKSLWTPGNHPMRQRLDMLLLQDEQLSSTPIFQTMFPWQETNDPNWRTYLHPNVLQLLGNFTPYRHQTESWRELSAGNSIVVTSGTGSGKTECFMHPILSKLCQNRTQNGNDPVQAIFLYPLNALMEDQKNRLGNLCQKLGLKFVVYNSTLDESDARVPVNQNYPNAEVMTRVAMRDVQRNRTSCPQIMLTNPSMLEFSLVRHADKPMYERSAGQLRYIVIDEAHTYSGSAAIELAFLLKRVLSAYGVTRDQVQFICTSATIGDPTRPQELLDYIEAIIGHSNAQDLVPIGGERVVPQLAISDIDQALTNNGITQTIGAKVQDLREQINLRPLTLEDSWHILSPLPFNTNSALNLIDRLCEIEIQGMPLLMVRGHFFMKAINGLYACINTACPSANGTDKLNHITTEKGSGFCPDCGAPLFELVQCSGCKEVLVACRENSNHEIRPLYITNKEDFDTEECDDFDKEYRNLDQNEDTPNDGANNNVDNDEEIVIANQNANAGNGQVIVNNDDWEEIYIRPNAGAYTRPHPNYRESYVNINYDAATSSFIAVNQPMNGDWVMLKNGRSYHCPTCGKGKGIATSKFYPFTLSSSWLNEVIAPALLREGAGNGFDWGKYIAFTDSRQGTAINAKKFNINSEKSFARASLVTRLSILQDDPIIAALRARQVPEAQIQALFPNPTQTLPELSLWEVADTICNDIIFDHINQEKNHNYANFQGDRDAYKTTLIRSHIGKRTMKFTGLESLGIITLVYPAINNINIPNEWLNAGFNVDEWQTFLKICLDYVIRLDNHLQPVLGNESAYLRESDRPTSLGSADWPIVRKDNNGNVKQIQSRLVLLLCAAMGIDNPTGLAGQENTINTLIMKAWEAIKSHILTPCRPNDPNNDQYYLDFSLQSQVCKVKFAESGWQCPVTKIFLDTTFRGYSPAIKGVLYRGNIQRYEVDPNIVINIPLANSPNLAAEKLTLAGIGFWNDRHKYAYAGTTQACLTAEHSGQQNRNLLRFYTNEFIANRLNLLQCSTTMEMGVDIGDIDTVLMTNIPPTSANYLQRAGRAGRRGQSKAVSFALCPCNSLGLQAFSNPMRLITGHTAAARTVNSNIIVQRHINSFFIKEFMYETDARFDNLNDWFTKQNGNNSIHNDFIQWLTNNRNNPAIQQRFDSIFPQYQFGQSIDRTKDGIDNIGQEYVRIINGIDQEYTTALNAGNNDKATALRIQLYKFNDQTVKIYFAEKQFLPNADMPTGIVEFNYIDSEDVRTIARLLQEIDNHKQSLNDPNLLATQRANIRAQINTKRKEIDKIQESRVTSREIKIALREYAPEQTVVVNEKNHISAGIEWENSFGQGNPWKYLYWCRTCGRHEYSDNPALTNCPCGDVYRNVLAPNGATPYCLVFEPIRFRTDVNCGENRAEETKRKFHQIDTILTNVDWANFQPGPMCEIIGNANAGGEILFTNMGEGKGFNLCLDCGKMEVHRFDRNPQNWPHNDIRVHHQACTNNNPRNKVMLIGKFPTSFVALRFYTDQTQQAYVSDRELLNSLGVILTRALAAEIGINPGEIDFDVRKENQYKSLYIYDTAKGGCDYSTQLLDPQIMSRTFDRAKQLLLSYNCLCENHVSKACAKCLVDRNSQRHEGKLSKQKLLVWLAQQNQINYTAIPGATPVYMPVKLLLTNLYSRIATNTISFCVDASSMNLQEWTNKDGVMGNLINECLLRGKTVELIVGNMPDFNTCDVQEMVPFIDLQAKFPNCIVRGVGSVSFNGHTSLMIVDGNHYFSTTPDVNYFNEEWGEVVADLYECNHVPQFTDVQFPSVNDFHVRLLPNEVTKNCTITRAYFDAMGVTRINEVFANVIAPQLLDDDDEDAIETILRGKRIRVTFSDAYVNSALSGLMLATIIKEFKEKYDFEIDCVDLKVQAPQNDPRFVNTRIKKGWNPLQSAPYVSQNHNSDTEADQYIQQAFVAELGITPNLEVVGDHCRWLTFQPVGESCRVEFRPDHGISGGWYCYKTYDYLHSLSGYTALKMHKNIDRIIFYLIYKRG